MRPAILALVLALVPWAATAEAPRPFPDFTFKRVTPPPPGTTRRITVQITPPEPELPVAPVSGATAAAPAVADPQVTAFWSAVGTGLAEASPARLALAEEAVRRAGIDGPKLQDLQALAAAHGRHLLELTIGRRVSPALALAVISVESSGRPEAVSRAGAEGLMQLMPATATRFGVTDSFDPAQNIDGGVAYLDWLMGRFGGDPVLALAGYNAGENAVIGASGVPDYAETRAYVPKVIAAWAVAKGLCVTPPDLASDGCVFASMAAR